MKKQIMKRAWEIARSGQQQFGGSVKSYFPESLKMAWNQFKTGGNMTKTEWKKGKHHRIYFNNVESVYDEKTGLFSNGEKADVFHYQTGEFFPRDSRKIQQQLERGTFYYDCKSEKWFMNCDVDVEKVLKNILKI